MNLNGKKNMVIVMSEKRFKVCIDSNNGVGLFDNSIRLLFIKFTNKEDAVRCKDSLKYQCNLMNELYDENKQLKEELQRFKKYVFSEDNILCYKCEHCIKKDIYVVDCEMKGKVDVHGLCSLFRKVKV